ncbi:MAG TPA: tRNA (N6-threonylcarbamoyladenosine(37)-N6)-methyltransferase TrmO [Bacteroidales bacterium]|nr:tRNA (N6-threonylcarbamoyladenosine(37)-N6)-methyltransferase TrmO [Bacteroidales bacterium]
MDFTFKPIGVIKTPNKQREHSPVHPRYARDLKGKVILDHCFTKGLKDLDGFSHMMIVFVLDRSPGYNLEVIPYHDTEFRGLFSTRSPNRPNPLGISVVKILSIKDNIITFEGPDMLDDSPLLDIKPYIPDFDGPEEIRIGWLEGKLFKEGDLLADDR